MNDMSSLPPVNPSQLAAMKKKAEEYEQKEGISAPEPLFQEVHPAIRPAEEPQYFAQETPEESIENSLLLPEPAPTTPPHVGEQAQEDSLSRNFKAVKEKARQLERERDEALKMAREAIERQKNPQGISELDLSSINPDDLVEGKHLTKVAQDMQALKQQLYLENQKARLRSQYPDFDKVVNRDTIETFQLAYPELASSLNSTQDVYAAGVSAYTLFRKFGIVNESDPEKEVAKKNAAKPRPLTSVSPQQGETPMSRANAFANGLTGDLKKQLWEEMRKNRG